MASDITIDGGAGGVVACIDEMERLATTVRKAAGLFDSASSHMSGYTRWGGRGTAGGGPGSGTRVRGEESPELAAARAQLHIAIDALILSPSSPARCRDRAGALGGTLDEAIEAYERAEATVSNRMNLLERARLFGLDVTGASAVGRGAATAGLLAWLTEEVLAGRVIGTPLAVTIRRYHPVIREFLQQVLSVFPKGGTPTTRQLAALLALVGRSLNSAAGLGRAKIRRVNVTTEKMSSRLIGLVKRVDRADWQVKNKTPSILVSRVITGSGSTRKSSWVVSLPPTSPLIGGRNPFDVIADIEAMGLGTNDIVDGLTQALKDAGAKKGESILMIGHSLGGITAAAAAASPAFAKRFSAPAIITLGSPISSIPISDKATVLALEHTEDVFAALSGAPNPKTPNFTTVTRDLATSSDAAERKAAKDFPGTASHARPYYTNTLAMVDASKDPSIQAFKKAIAPIMVAGAKVVTIQYEVTRSVKAK
ncbi:MAG: hypothetical protein LBK72_07140 [Bifidobacteriaceae bacterium]|jgi:hypothetical protein|nr:hypothetical protein [Bifidobacteriaceae bacterium]